MFFLFLLFQKTDLFATAVLHGCLTFVLAPKTSTFAEQSRQSAAPWVVQPSFHTICKKPRIITFQIHIRSLNTTSWEMNWPKRTTNSNWCFIARNPSHMNCRLIRILFFWCMLVWTTCRVFRFKIRSPLNCHCQENRLELIWVGCLPRAIGNRICWTNQF